MATISFNDSAPKFDEPVRFVFAGYDFELGTGKSYDSDEPELLSSVSEHPWLKVEYPAVDENVTSDYDPTDPHDNPAADHLSEFASKESKDAAAAAEEEIAKVAYPENTPDVAAEDDVQPDAAATSPQDPAPEQAAQTKRLATPASPDGGNA